MIVLTWVLPTMIGICRLNEYPSTTELLRTVIHRVLSLRLRKLLSKAISQVTDSETHHILIYSFWTHSLLVRSWDEKCISVTDMRLKLIGKMYSKPFHNINSRNKQIMSGIEQWCNGQSHTSPVVGWLYSRDSRNALGSPVMRISTVICSVCTYTCHGNSPWLGNQLSL